MQKYKALEMPQTRRKYTNSILVFLLIILLLDMYKCTYMKINERFSLEMFLKSVLKLEKNDPNQS